MPHTVAIPKNHPYQVLLSRAPKALPRMVINSAVTDITDFSYADFKLEGYDPHPAIKAEVAV